MRPPEQTPATLGLIELNNGTAAWRIMYPMEYLNRRGYSTAYGINGDPKASRMIVDADLVVMHRLAWRGEDQHKALLWRRLLHAAGKAICYEVDDDLLTPAIIERIHRTTDLQRTDKELDFERKQHLFAIQISDGVICSTDRLAEICRGLTDRPVIVVPNAIDLHRFRLIMGIERRRPPEAPPTIAWIGGNRPNRDAMALAVAWARIADRYPSVRFKVGGYPLPVLMNAVPRERLDHVPWMPIESYPRIFANVDIGCAPLNNEPFNTAKSWIKAIEYAAAGAAVVASPIVYGSILRHGENGMLCRTADEWTAALSVLLDYPEQRRALAATLTEEVEASYCLDANAGRWPEAWSEIVADFRVRLLTLNRSTGSTLPRRMEYDTASSPILRA